MAESKINQLDFLRVYFTLVIVAFHLLSSLVGLFPGVAFFANLAGTVRYGGICVDYFFILSGFFLVLTLNPERSIGSFTFRRIARLWPVAIFSSAMLVLTGLVANNRLSIGPDLFAVFFLDNVGLTLTHADNGLLWYVSALFWVSLFYYQMITTFPKKKVDFWIAVLVFLCYAAVINLNHGHMQGNVENYFFVFNSGLTRAVADMGVGYFLVAFYRSGMFMRIREFMHARSSARITCVAGATILEVLCLGFLTYSFSVSRIIIMNEFLFVLVFIVLITLFLLQIGYISRALNGRVWCRLSKYTYSAFLMHLLVREVFRITVWKTQPGFVLQQPVLNLLLPLVAAVAVGVATYYLVEQPGRRFIMSLAHQVPEPTSEG
jgi:peptidoglycan/LPS O-acetylase OafA/YrhL